MIVRSQMLLKHSAVIVNVKHKLTVIFNFARSSLSSFVVKPGNCSCVDNCILYMQVCLMK